MQDVGSFNYYNFFFSADSFSFLSFWNDGLVFVLKLNMILFSFY